MSHVYKKYRSPKAPEGWKNSQGNHPQMALKVRLNRLYYVISGSAAVSGFLLNQSFGSLSKLEGKKTSHPSDNPGLAHC